MLTLLLALVVQFSFAQEKTISGTVTDGSGLPLPGATVLVKGTTSGTTSDFDGKYSIKVNQGDTLVFSFVGNTTKEVTIGSSNIVNVTLTEDATSLEEVVITGSASGKSIKELSFALGQVNNELLDNVPAASAGQALQGKISGLSVSPSGGQPGSDVNIQLRTANSIATGQNPLIILDGVILEGGLADINTEDIDRIEVAKGAAGASLYGSRAANGVIQIFSKRGKYSDKVNVTYRSEVGWRNVNAEYDLATTHKFLMLPDGSNFDLSTGSRQLDPDGFADNPYPAGSQLYDNQDRVLRTGQFNSHFASVNGGSENSRYLFSYSRLSDEGIFKEVDDYRRDNFRLNLDNKISEKLNLKTSIFYGNSRRDAAINSGSTANVLFSTLMTEPIHDMLAPNEEDGSPYNYDFDTIDGNNRNPLYSLANNDREERRNRVLGNVALDYKVMPWLTLNGSYSYDYENNAFENYIPKGFLSDNPDGQAKDIGFIQRSNFNGRAQNIRFNALFQDSFGTDDAFNLNFRLSYLNERYKSAFNNAEGYNLAVGGIRSLDNIKDRPALASESQTIISDSYFAIADFDYKGKYIFSGVVRREGSSLFGPDTRWANYFRTSLAYRVTEDIEIPGVQELKLRASYGTAGIRPTYEMRFETFSLRNGSATKSTIGNNFLKPAKTGELELGVNIDFLDRFSFEFNYVKAVTDDQILRVPLSAATGFGAQWRNAGEIEGTTLEASLNYDIIKNENFSWNLGIVWDKSEQKITRLDVPSYLTGPGTQNTTFFRVEEGQNFGIMYGSDFIKSLSDLPSGLDPNDYLVNGEGYVVDAATGSTPVARVDDEGNAFFVIGDITPDFRAAINTTLKYKNFSFYTLFDWKQGGDIYNRTNQWLYRDTRHAVSANSQVPASFYAGLYNTGNPSSGFVEDGSFVKLRELSLYYTLDGENMGNIGNFIESMRIGFIGRNLITWTDYTGFDPEITNQAEASRSDLTSRDTNGLGNDVNTPGGDPNVFKVDNFPYPTTKSYSFSVQLNF